MDRNCKKNNLAEAHQFISIMLSKHKFTLTKRNIFSEYRRLEIGEVIISGDQWNYFSSDNISNVSDNWFGDKINKNMSVLKSGQFLRKL